MCWRSYPSRPALESSRLCQQSRSWKLRCHIPPWRSTFLRFYRPFWPFPHFQAVVRLCAREKTHPGCRRRQRHKGFHSGYYHDGHRGPLRDVLPELGDVLPGLAVKRAAYVGEWIRAESHYRDIALSAHDAENDEGAYVLHMADLMQDGDLLFSANSMSIRFIDTFMVAGGKQLHFMCNRGLNGIDGTLSTALGAAGAFPRAALLCGDLAFLHDVNALHLIEGYTGSLTIVLLNNSGGGIFELLPQKSDEPWFEKLFSTPVTPDYASIAKGFGISYHLVSSLSDFDEAFNRVYGHGVSIIEIKTTLEGLAQRSNGYR